MYQSTDNLLHPFLIDHSHIRGQLVRISGVVDEILTRHAYPEPVSRLLGEMLVIAALLSANLKSDGILTLQARGEGPVKFLVVDVSDKGALRGYAEMDAVAKGKIPKTSRSKKMPTLAAMLGKGYLALTLDQGPGARYQGIVDLSATTTTEAIQAYFTQSQQVEIAVKLHVVKKAASKGSRAHWHAAGMMIEQIPEEGGIQPEEKTKPSDAEPTTLNVKEHKENQWLRTKLFMETLQESEIVSPELPTWQLLERLFGEDGVWAYHPKAITSDCRCSRTRVSEILASLPKTELNAMTIDGEVTVNCQFCNRTQHFSQAQIDEL